MGMQTYNLTAVVNRQGDHFYAFCTQTPTSGAGDNQQQAMADLVEETRRYLLDGYELGDGEPEVITADFVAHTTAGPSQTYTYHLIIYYNDSWYLSYCSELGITDQGRSREEAISLLKQGVEFYLQHYPAVASSKPAVQHFEVETGVAQLANA